MGKVIIVIATVVAVVLGGYFVAVRINPALAGGDVAPLSVEGEDEEADTGTPDSIDDFTERATIGGVLTPLSSGTDDGSLLLHIVGKGYLPVHLDPSIGMPGPGQSLVVAVPADFDSSDDNEEQFDRLRELADTIDQSLEVVAFE